MDKGGNNTTTTTQQIDPRVMSLITGNYNKAQQVTNTPTRAYNGDPYAYLQGNINFNPNNFAAPLAANQNYAVGQARTLGDAGSGLLSQAAAGANAARGFAPDKVDPMMSGNVTSAPVNAGNAALGTTNTSLLPGISQYQNPYTDTVVNNALSDIERQRQQAVAGNASAATGANAFGGSRQAVTDALTNEAALRAAGSTSGQLRDQGFNTAAGLAGQDVSNNLNATQFNANATNNMRQFNASNLLNNNQFNASNRLNNNQFNANAGNNAAFANQNAGLNAANLNLSGSGLLGNLSGMQQNNAQNQLAALLQTGGVQQGTNQLGLNSAYQEFLRTQQQPYQNQTLLNQTLGLLPQSGTTTTTGPQQNNWGSLLGGLGSLAYGASFLCDERLKKDIVGVGQDHKGRNWYLFRYLWDGPEDIHFGVMAQEIIESDPDAVSMGDDGYYRVNYSKLVH